MNSTIELNRSQALIHNINANVTHCLMPRANGKTEGGAGIRFIHLSEVMPRSQVILYTDTFERIEGALIPNIMSFISNKLNLVEDEDFFVFKKPPDFWVKPYIIPRKFDRVVSFKTGMAMCCGAAFKDGSVNGYNAQAAIIDETKFVRQDRIKSQLLRALRGQRHIFGHLPEYRSLWTFTDKYEGDISWILKIRDKQDNKLIQSVLTAALKVNEYKAEMSLPGISDSRYYSLKTAATSLESKLNLIRKELVYVCDSKPFENIEILGAKFYRDAKRDCQTIFEYNTAILNKDPDVVPNTFYPALSKIRHYHSIMDDTSESQTLIAAMDYQWRITPMAIAQLGVLPGRSIETLNFVNAIHTLHPEGGIEETVQAMCDYYITRVDKVVYYAYDHTAVGRRPDGKSFKDIAVEKWDENGWIVIEIHTGQAPEHDFKHEEIKKLMTVDRIQLNVIRAEPLKKSIQHAGAVKSANKTKKDKSQEKKLNNDPVEQTDYSDAADTIIIATLVMELITSDSNSFVPDIASR